MPTLLEKALLTDMIADLDQQQLKDILSHLAEVSFELIAERVMAVRRRERARPRNAGGIGQASGSGLNAAPVVELERGSSRQTRTPRPASDLGSFTMSSDDDDEDDSTVATATRPSSPPRPGPQTPTHSDQEQRRARLIYAGRRCTADTQEKLRKVIRIIDNFDWTTQDRKDFLDLYVQSGVDPEDPDSLAYPYPSLGVFPRTLAIICFDVPA